MAAATRAPMADVGPAVSASRAFTLLADARIDNRDDFRSGLDLSGRECEFLSEAEFIARCIDRWGTDVVGRLVGDFALIAWDRRSEQLILARDFAGQRPLHFHQTAGTVAVASMAKGLHALDHVERGFDQQRLIEAAAGLAHQGRRTFYREIRRVEPGEMLTLDPSGHRGLRFWEPPRTELRLKSASAYAEGMMEQLDRSVKARLPADGPIGTHLSAGLDSSAVTTSAARTFPGKLVAFTAVPPDRLPQLPRNRFGDESQLAALTAALYPNIEHRLVPMGDSLPLHHIGRDIEIYERPDLNHPNLAWASRIFRAAASEGIGVLLTGANGNLTVSYGERVLLGELITRRRIGRFCVEYSAARRSGASHRELAGPVLRHILPRGLVCFLDRRMRSGARSSDLSILRPGPMTEAIFARSEWESAAAHGRAETRAAMIGRSDPGTFNKGVLLTHGVDLRDPTADRSLLEFCFRIPPEQYLRKGMTRAVLRRGLEGRVPGPVRLEPRRGLQSPHWFSMLCNARLEARRALIEIENCPEAVELIDTERLRKLLDELPTAGDEFGALVYRHGLLRGLSAGMFIRQTCIH